MKKDCGHCSKNYTGECKPSDVADCYRQGRHTKFVSRSPEFCPDCGGESTVHRTDKDLKAIDYCIPRTRICSACGQTFKTGEFLLS